MYRYVLAVCLVITATAQRRASWLNCVYCPSVSKTATICLFFCQPWEHLSRAHSPVAQRWVGLRSLPKDSWTDGRTVAFCNFLILLKKKRSQGEATMMQPGCAAWLCCWTFKPWRACELRAPSGLSSGKSCEKIHEGATNKPLGEQRHSCSR